MAKGLISFNILFLLLLLLIPSANSAGEIQEEAEPQSSLIPLTNSTREIETKADPQSSLTGAKSDEKIEKSVKFHKSVYRKKSEEVTQEELAAVDGNISAVYIIRVINERADKLKLLKTEAMDTIRDRNTRQIYAELWSDSTLPDSEIETLTSGLVRALKEERYKMFFLNPVKGHIKKCETERPQSHSRLHNLKEKIEKVARFFSLGRRQNANDPVELCKKVREEHVNFLKQIRLEVELHYSFKSLDLGEFRETGDNLKIPKYSHMASMKLHDAAKNVYIDITELLRSPLRHQQEESLEQEHKFVTSLLEVAHIAQVAEGKEPEDLTAINYLKKIYDMADTVDSTLRTIALELKWPKEIHEEIGKKLEMPREWFGRMRAQAYPHDKHGRLIVTEEALNVQVELLLAKTLLVYERLNKIYEIDRLYKMQKGTKLYEKNLLLALYFEQFENDKKRKVTAVAASAAAQASDNPNV